jgi:DNA-directed RNA polymerase subunit alpha
MLVTDLRLSGRAANCLHEEGITTIRELVARTREELLEVRNFGENTLQELEEKLQELGLRLGMEAAAAAEN